MSRVVEVKFVRDVPLPGRDGIGLLEGKHWKPLGGADVKRKGQSMVFTVKRRVFDENRNAKTRDVQIEVPLSSIDYIVTCDLEPGEEVDQKA